MDQSLSAALSRHDGRITLHVVIGQLFPLNLIFSEAVKVLEALPRLLLLTTRALLRSILAIIILTLDAVTVVYCWVGPLTLENRGCPKPSCFGSLASTISVFTLLPGCSVSCPPSLLVGFLP